MGSYTDHVEEISAINKSSNSDHLGKLWCVKKQSAGTTKLFPLVHITYIPSFIKIEWVLEGSE